MLTLKDRLLKYEHLLNDTDDQIIEYILEHTTEVTKMSVQTLAVNVFTVPNTIIRLSRKLGYDGFSHMKSMMKEEKNEQNNFSSSDKLKKTKELIDDKKLDLVNQLIANAPRVLIYGIGDSALYCEYLMNGYRVVNKKCEFYMHRHNTLSELELLTSKDVLILISVSGESPQLVDLATRAIEKGVKIIAITDFHVNSLQSRANQSLYFASPSIHYHQHNITDPTPIFYLLRSLLESYWALYMETNNK